MAAKTTKKSSKSTMNDEIVEKTYQEIVKDSHKLACCVEFGKGFLILSEDVESKEYFGDFAISGICNSEDMAWKSAAHRIVNG